MPVIGTSQDRLFVLGAIALIVFTDGSNALATIAFSALTIACFCVAVMRRKSGERLSVREAVPMALALSGLFIALSGANVTL